MATEFNDVLRQALTLGVKHVSPSKLPQFIGLIVYVGLITVIWAGLTLRLSPMLVSAAVALLTMAAIMAVLLLMGAGITPVVLNLLVVVVVVGFLVVCGYSVVQINMPSGETRLQSNLRYADSTSAPGFLVTVNGSQSGATTTENGYFDLPISPATDVHDGKVYLHIETMDHSYGEDKEIQIKVGVVNRPVAIKLDAGKIKANSTVRAPEASTAETSSSNLPVQSGNAAAVNSVDRKVTANPPIKSTREQPASTAKPSREPRSGLPEWLTKHAIWVFELNPNYSTDLQGCRTQHITDWALFTNEGKLNHDDKLWGGGTQIPGAPCNAFSECDFDYRVTFRPGQSESSVTYHADSPKALSNHTSQAPTCSERGFLEAFDGVLTKNTNDSITITIDGGGTKLSFQGDKSTLLPR